MPNNAQRIYFPIGQPVTAEQLTRYSVEQLLNRQIDDPRFAGFEKGFDWHHYVRVEIEDAYLKTQVEKVLNQFALTPEGQQTFRQALAAQTYRDQTNSSLSGTTDHRTVLTDQLYPGIPRLNLSHYLYGIPHVGWLADIAQKVDLGQTTRSLPADGMIVVGDQDYRLMKYKGQDGRYHHITLQSTIAHELQHAKDPLMGPDSERALGDYMATKIPNATQGDIDAGVKLIQEVAAIKNSNPYMRKYYHMKERDVNYLTPKAYQLKWIPWDLNPFDGMHNFTYDDIQTPKVPQKAAQAKASIKTAPTH